MAKGNRKAAEKVILEWVGKIDPSGKNVDSYKAMFSKMSDTQFDDYMKAIEDGKDYVSVIVDNLNGSVVSTDNNLKVAKEMGHDFFHRIWVTDPATGTVYLTNEKYLVVDLPVRRQIQTLVNKISIPEDNKHIDDLTDQPTGVSKGSSLSLPEILVLYAQGHDRAIEELIKFRGGDLTAMNAMDRQILETGGTSLDAIASHGTRPTSTTTLATLLKGMHLDNNF